MKKEDKPKTKNKKTNNLLQLPLTDSLQFLYNLFCESFPPLTLNTIKIKIKTFLKVFDYNLFSEGFSHNFLLKFFHQAPCEIRLLGEICTGKKFCVKNISLFFF